MNNVRLVIRVCFFSIAVGFFLIMGRNGVAKISLSQDTIDSKDIDKLCEWLKKYPRLTKGEKTLAFERQWADYIGTKHAVFVNSGSSANLLMLYALVVSKRLKNDKVVVPALSWATDLAPVIQLGLKPILCDCNLQNLAVDVMHLEKIFKEENPAALICVSVLGFSPDFNEITDLCRQHDVVLLEDDCESLGSTYEGKKLGSFGLMSSFSLYFGHHLSTIEGGVVCTDDDEIHDVLLSIRSHGWSRDLSSHKRCELKEKWSVSDFNELYTFYYPGFNLRATDLQAFIGLGQLEKIKEVVQTRYRNLNFFSYDDLIYNPYWKPKAQAGSFVSSFAYPVIHPKRDEIVKKLQENDVEVRPLICGSMGMQPFYVERYGVCHLPNAEHVDTYGFYVPNHPSLSKEDIAFVSELINSITRVDDGAEAVA